MSLQENKPHSTSYSYVLDKKSNELVKLNPGTGEVPQSPEYKAIRRRSGEVDSIWEKVSNWAKELFIKLAVANREFERTNNLELSNAGMANGRIFDLFGLSDKNVDTDEQLDSSSDPVFGDLFKTGSTSDVDNFLNGLDLSGIDALSEGENVESSEVPTLENDEVSFEEILKGLTSEKNPDEIGDLFEEEELTDDQTLETATLAGDFNSAREKIKAEQDLIEKINKSGNNNQEVIQGEFAEPEPPVRTKPETETLAIVPVLITPPPEGPNLEQESQKLKEGLEKEKAELTNIAEKLAQKSIELESLKTYLKSLENLLSNIKSNEFNTGNLAPVGDTEIRAETLALYHETINSNKALETQISYLKPSQPKLQTQIELLEKEIKQITQVTQPQFNVSETELRLLKVSGFGKEEMLETYNQILNFATENNVSLKAGIDSELSKQIFSLAQNRTQTAEPHSVHETQGLESAISECENSIKSLKENITSNEKFLSEKQKALEFLRNKQSEFKKLKIDLENKYFTGILIAIEEEQTLLQQDIEALETTKEKDRSEFARTVELKNQKETELTKAKAQKQKYEAQMQEQVQTLANKVTKIIDSVNKELGMSLNNNLTSEDFYKLQDIINNIYDSMDDVYTLSNDENKAFILQKSGELNILEENLQELQKGVTAQSNQDIINAVVAEFKDQITKQAEVNKALLEAKRQELASFQEQLSQNEQSIKDLQNQQEDSKKTLLEEIKKQVVMYTSYVSNSSLEIEEFTNQLENAKATLGEIEERIKELESKATERSSASEISTRLNRLREEYEAKAREAEAGKATGKTVVQTVEEMKRI